MTNAADDDVRTRALAPHQSLCSLIAINEMVAFFFFFARTLGWSALMSRLLRYMFYCVTLLS